MKRVVDANLNRAREGLRVIEEVCRFILNDAALSAKLKQLRHSLGAAAGDSVIDTLSSRTSSGDVAAFLNPASEQLRADLRSLVLANAKRVEESLRVLEEFSKLPESGIGTLLPVVKEARFAVYEVEKTIISRLLRREKAGKIAGLYVIVDSELVGERDETGVAQLAIEGGATVIQLRDKRGEKGRMLCTALRLKAICDELGALLIVNDHVDVAILAGSGGVHVGQKDLPVSDVRKLVPIDMLVGCSTATVDEARQAVVDGADYLGVGAMFPTSTKSNTRPAGLTAMTSIREAVTVPLVGIGGINADNAGLVMQAGGDAVAVISAVVLAADIRLAAEGIVRAIAVV
ncbi:MAG: thiamine phosphate synthase [Dehalococcoidia bacterium]|nr:thiamine phosphate synthase [Dehalococcoidia bacterium]